MNYDVIIVGAGIAGLTAAAYLSKAGYKTLLCEKEKNCGGLVSTFQRGAFTYDGGIRAIENSGIVFPMLKQLGLKIEFVKNEVSLGIEDQVIRFKSAENVKDYEKLLMDLYPESSGEIGEIIAQIRKIMVHMDVQYGIDNPLFLDMKQDRDYLMKVILPWIPKYALTVRKISAMNEPVIPFLQRYTKNQSLLDIIAQHFFQDTPAFFALSYIKLYLDYYYPLGGTGKVIEALVKFIENHQAEIRTNTEIIAVDPERRFVTDAKGNRFAYRSLVWTADQKRLYQTIDPDTIEDNRLRTALHGRRKMISNKIGNDSVLTLYLGVNLDASYFSDIASEHFFYTPSKEGQSKAGEIPLGGSKETIQNWLEKFFALTTYEISCPVMRDSSMAPKGQAGLIVSVLFDYQLTKQIEQMGWYEEFKSYCERLILNTLDASIYPGIRQAVQDSFVSTPLTISEITGNTDGAITGWSFTNDPVPAESRLPRVLNAIKTPIPGVIQAGQWTFSPSGLPISILTGKMAADRAHKELKKRN